MEAKHETDEGTRAVVLYCALRAGSIPPITVVVRAHMGTRAVKIEGHTPHFSFRIVAPGLIQRRVLHSVLAESLRRRAC